MSRLGRYLMPVPPHSERVTLASCPVPPSLCNSNSASVRFHRSACGSIVLLYFWNLPEAAARQSASQRRLAPHFFVFQVLDVFSKNLPLGRFFLVVAMCIYLYICPLSCNLFRGLLLANTGDMFSSQACHWLNYWPSVPSRYCRWTSSEFCSS